MSKKIMIIDDEKEFIDTVFKPKLSQWNVNYEVISNKTFGDINDDNLAEFTKEIISIAENEREEISVIFLDLGLDRSDSPALGFRIARSLRDIFFDIPIIAITRFTQAEIMEEGYLYDFDRYITKPEFGSLGAIGLNGILHQVITKRDMHIDKIPQYYEQMKKIRKDSYSITSAFGHTFTNLSSNLESVLLDTISIHKKFDDVKRQTVIIFSDLCDSTIIKQKQGFWEGLSITRLHNEFVTNIIHQYNGKIVKYIGDCVMGRFDYNNEGKVEPDAINAAIQINEALNYHNSRYRKDADYKIRTKIGIAVGRVVDFYGNDPQGSCVDLAARIQSLAKPSQILISGTFQALINISVIRSTFGKAENRDSHEYLSGPFKVSLAGFEKAQNIYEVFWSKEKLGVK